MSEWQVHTGDWRDVLPRLEAEGVRVDAVVTDPPYGMRWNTDSTRFTWGTHKRMSGRDDWGDIRGDDEPFDPAPLMRFPKVVLWGANHYAARLPVGTSLVWVKKAPHLFQTFLSDAEIGWMKGGHGVYCFGKQFPPPSRIAEGGIEGRAAHPTQKPVALMEWCLEMAKVPEGATVLDPYCGSGSTGVACLRTGRKFIGIEIEPRYAEIARRRCEREAAQPMLIGAGA